MADRNGRRTAVPMTVAVQRVEKLTPSMVRITLIGEDLERFGRSEQTDSYVKVLFGQPGVEYPKPLDMDRVRAEFAREQWPRVRSYTVRAWDQATRELTLDFVVHGDQGVAGPWAASAQPGDEVFLLGPGGGYAPDPNADWHLLVGDESALPAIAVTLERRPAGAEVLTFVEVHGAEDEIALAAPVTWVHRGDQPVGLALVDAVRAATRPVGTPHVFVHGEAGFVKELRRWLRVDLGLPKEQLSISGYWRYGADDEAWRASKAEWNREVEAAEAVAAQSA